MRYSVKLDPKLASCADFFFDDLRIVTSISTAYSFDAGFGSAYLSRVIGEKRAREVWFLCKQYSAQTINPENFD